MSPRAGHEKRVGKCRVRDDGAFIPVLRVGHDIGEGIGGDEMAHVLLQGEIDGGGTFATFGREGRAREDALAI